MGPEALAQVLRPLGEILDERKHPDLLVGLRSGDDAAVYRLNDQQALILTTDFFTPIVDDPYTFGAIAAANAMSDVYAMGGQVLLALNIAAFPANLPTKILSDIFRGGADKVAEGGGIIAGGHTITDEEPKYGLAVTGLVHPERVVTRAGARRGDILVLTKPLGVGIIATALRAGAAKPQDLEEAVESMLALNRTAAQLMQEVGVSGATDITGFALLGHAYEVCANSGVGMGFLAEHIPVFTGALEYAAQGYITGGAGRNRRYLRGKVRFDRQIGKELEEILHDPQTSGGLLIALQVSRLEALVNLFTENGQGCWLIGEVTEGQGIEIV